MRYDSNTGITIMLVDTNEKFLQFFQQFLSENLPYKFISEKSGTHALLTANQKPVHLFLMESKLAQPFNGLKVLELIRNDDKLAKVPVIFVSALRDKVTIAKAKSAGAAEYFFKPIKEAEIIKSVVKYLKKSVKFTVLVVDDDERSFYFLKNTIQSRFPYGAEVITVNSALTGLDIIDAQEINLLICGNNMPTVNGVRMLEMLRSRGQLENLPAIFVPENLSDDDRFTLAELGIENYLEKPFQPKKLIENMMQALNVPPPPMFEEDLILID